MNKIMTIHDNAKIQFCSSFKASVLYTSNLRKETACNSYKKAKERKFISIPK